MPRLTATFDVSLASRLLVNRPARQELRYATTIDDSDVEIALLEVHHAMTKGDQTIWMVPRVRVSVSRTETAEPPRIRRSPEGGRNIRDRAPYFSERIVIYRKVAIEALRRFLRFFKYRQAHALLRDTIGDDLDNPEWTDETGQEVPSGVRFRELPLYGIQLNDEVGIQALAGADEPALQQVLAEPPSNPSFMRSFCRVPVQRSFRGICAERFSNLRYRVRSPLGTLSSSKRRQEDIRKKRFTIS
jgi:hypothetical protein